MKRKSFLLVSFVLFSLLISAQKPTADPIEKKINILIKKMTLDEKVGQMFQIDPSAFFKSSSDVDEWIRKGKIGSVLNVIGAEKVNALQRIAVKESRLGIPLIVGRDVIHGYRTIMPIPLAMSSSWNPEMVAKAMHVSGKEASSDGIRWTFAPMIDISRDPRWGRVAEGPGEDPYLASAMAKAMVEGVQGEDLAASGSIAACAKHFVGYGAAEGGRDYNTSLIPETELRNIYLPSFKAAKDAGVATYMSSFNDINGIPASGNRHTLHDILRNEWGFNGFVVSDWGSIAEMINHGFCATSKDAAEKGINAGVDMEMSSSSYIENIKTLLDEKKISIQQINESVANILRIKFKLGLFDHPYTSVSTEKVLLTDDNLKIAKEMAIESAVLLKNDKQILPLSKSLKIAVIGPLADAPHDQMGTWVFDGKKADSKTVLPAIIEKLGATQVVYAKGLSISRDKSVSGFVEAVEAARNADVCVLVVGEESILSGEAHSLAELHLQGKQNELIEAVAAVGKPVVMVVMAGRPLAIGNLIPKVDAILYAWHNGTMGGPAIADLLFGDAIPSGKLPITFPKGEGQIPIYYNHKSTGRPADIKNWTPLDKIPVEAVQHSLGNTSHYLDYGFEPLFPFGYGLSYTTFAYSNLKVSKSVIPMNGLVEVSVDITNTGKYEADEVAQLYIHDRFGSITRPVKELKGFKRVSLKPGETKSVSFTLTKTELAFWNNESKFQAESGDFDVWIGSNSVEGLKGSFAIK